MTAKNTYNPVAAPASTTVALVDRVPPHLFFVMSAVFHYLGPSFAVLLFQHIEVLGVAWLRIASAALVFAIWRRPWSVLVQGNRSTRLLIVGLGAVLAVMNACFYLAIARMPLASVAAIEFVATIAVALAGVRSGGNLLALVLAMSGVYLLINPEWSSADSADWIGLLFAFLNAALFALYIVLGHAVSRATGGIGGVDRLGAAMLVALIFAVPIGFADAVPAFTSPTLLLAGIGVGVSSSVIPYVCDQLAMARLPRATFALLLALLPATAALVGAVVLRQVPTSIELLGIALVALGVRVHKPSE